MKLCDVTTAIENALNLHGIFNADVIGYVGNEFKHAVVNDKFILLLPLNMNCYELAIHIKTYLDSNT